MTVRERNLAIVLGALITLGAGGLLVEKLFLAPLRDGKEQLRTLVDETKKLTERRDKIEAERPRLERWKQLSLPSDVELARRDYQSFLEQLARESGVSGGNVTVAAKANDRSDVNMGPAKGNKTPVYTRLGFDVRFKKCSFANIVKFLKEFYSTSLLHQIKFLSIQRTTGAAGQASNELETAMTIEALVVNGAGNRLYLLPNIDRKLLIADAFVSWVGVPGGLLTAGWAAGPTGPRGPGLLANGPAIYDALASKDLFHNPGATVEEPRGTPDWISPRYAKLTDLTKDNRNTEGSIWDVWNKRKFRLRASPGFDSFPLVKDGQGLTVAGGKVLKMDFDNREIVLKISVTSSDPSDRQSDDRFYRLSAKDRDNLLQAQLITTDDSESVFWVSQKYWQTLVRDQVIKTDEDGGSFRIEMAADKGGPAVNEDNRVEVTQGKIIRQDKSSLVVRFEEKYCALHAGNSVEDALNKPLPANKVREMKSAKAERP